MSFLLVIPFVIGAIYHLVNIVNIFTGKEE